MFSAALPGRRVRGAPLGPGSLWPRSVDLWWASIHVPYSDWFHIKIHWFVNSELHVWTCLLQAVSSRARWDCKIKLDFYLINGQLKPVNALWDVWLFDCILNQCEKLTLRFLSASWLTQNWWSEIGLCTGYAINECLDWLISLATSKSDSSPTKKSNCLSTFALAFLVK